MRASLLLVFEGDLSWQRGLLLLSWDQQRVMSGRHEVTVPLGTLWYAAADGVLTALLVYEGGTR